MGNQGFNRVLLVLLLGLGLLTTACAQPLPEESVSYEEASQAYRSCYESSYPSQSGSAHCDQVQPNNGSALSFNQWAYSYKVAHPSSTVTYHPTEQVGAQEYIQLRHGYEMYLNSLDPRIQYEMADQWDYLSYGADPRAVYYY